MINKAEIRIGNYITDSGGNVWQIHHWEGEDKVASERPVLSIGSNTGIPVYGHPATEYVNDIKPVVIDRKFLQKLWFKQIEENKFILNNFIVIDYFNYVYTLNFGNTKIVLQGVHHLQNIVFDIWGIELSTSKMP